ncbi:putative disease resistance RPP13-like protein 1 [Acorus calamus]|uniref:Disease resistance RPP13-like protein 1 n=1 Tax=Acorus calamus TaxID=4465 RepID=A0AAV9DPJ8_ACOCL|nr:putative disease resistance RPP13-like protein 1 [Acorus calamus]
MDNRKKSRVFAITGMGGIGKTTLAQKIFHHEKIDTHFKTKIWVCVSQEFVGNELLRRIIRQAGNGSIGEQGSKSELQRDLKQVLGKRPFLLVLDDAWSGRLWEDFLRVPLEGCSKRSRVLVTTRNEDIATAKMDAYHCHKVKLLSPKDGWLLLKKVVYRNREMENTEMLREVGMKIVEQCNGLPLAIKTVGGVLKTKNKSKEAWERVLHSEAWKFSELPDDIMPALLFSYDDMPPHLKQCFLYCSLFPEDFEFSESLIKQMWIAEGFVKEEEGYFEEMADDYFRELVVRSFLHLENHFYNVTIYKMHDMLRALGLYLTRHERFLRELHGLEAASIMPRRLSVIGSRLEEIPEVVKKQKCLRTLLLFDNPLNKKVEEDVFHKLKCIRVLDLSKSNIETLPDSIKNLIHLKFLNLSSTPLKILPDSVCQLWNLQTLNLRFCQGLKKLPSGISQLTNLRHLDLEFTGVKRIPMGIEKLKNLRALHGLVFDVALRDLPRLRSLILYGLELINHGEKAKLAELKNKMHLESVHLICKRSNSFGVFLSEAEDLRRIEEIYEALSLPSSVTSLVITGFFGRMLPQWTFSSSSSNLSYLQLCRCINIHCLPMLGQLPHLRILDIQSTKMIKKIGPEFLFGENANRRRGAFLKLEALYFCDMAKWEEWSYTFDGDDDEEERVQIMPRLSKLSLQNCPYLKSLPEDLLNHATNLRELHVDKACSLTSIKNFTSVAELNISSNDSLQLVANFPSLGSLKIYCCRALEEVDNIGGPGGLKYLEFNDSSISALPEWFKCMMTSGTTSSVQARLYLMVSRDFLRQFVPYNGLYWPFIKSFPRVDAESSFFDLYFSYVKSPFHFESNFETGINNDPTSDSDVKEDSSDSDGNDSEDDDHPPPS